MSRVPLLAGCLIAAALLVACWPVPVRRAAHRLRMAGLARPATDLDRSNAGLAPPATATDLDRSNAGLAPPATATELDRSNAGLAPPATATELDRSNAGLAPPATATELDRSHAGLSRPAAPTDPDRPAVGPTRPAATADPDRRSAGRTAIGMGRWAARTDVIRLSAALAGLAVLVVVGGWVGLFGAVLTATVADRLLRRVEPRAVRDRRLRELADLPLAADLLAATLRAGAPVDHSVLAVADALGGPLADRLGRVGRTLLLGGGPDEAWAHLTPVPGADRLVTAAVRSSSSGAALAGALTRLADDLRADRATAAEASARRAGVLIVLPLGLCFLPAFILAGLVPVIVAVLGDVL